MEKDKRHTLSNVSIFSYWSDIALKSSVCAKLQHNTTHWDDNFNQQLKIVVSKKMPLGYN